MYGRNYIEKDIGLDLYRKKCLDLHMKKLQNIKTKNKKIEIKKVEEVMVRKNEEKQRNFEFIKSEKEIEVNRNNKKLLEKLVEISKGKHLSVEAFQPITHSVSTTNIEGFRPKSLNIVSRKKESQKIEEDNFKFAKRLFESQGLISAKEMKQQFKDHVKIKKQVRKLVLKNDKSRGRHGMLPPLTQASNTVKGITKTQQQINDDLLKASQDHAQQDAVELSQQQQYNVSSQQILAVSQSKPQSKSNKQKPTTKSTENQSLKSSHVEPLPKLGLQNNQETQKAVVQKQVIQSQNSNKSSNLNSSTQLVNIANDSETLIQLKSQDTNGVIEPLLGSQRDTNRQEIQPLIAQEIPQQQSKDPLNQQQQ
eukprot:403364530